MPLAILALFAASGTARASACEAVVEVPGQLQVAWVAPLGKRVGASTSLEVVRVSDLRAMARSSGDDLGRFLQGLGMLGRKVPDRRLQRGWQIVIFDVDRDWLCRPIEDGIPGEQVGGVAVCNDSELEPRSGHRKGWTGCGYSLDTGASNRGVDVFRIEWQDAATNGFCLMPAERFLDGA